MTLATRERHWTLFTNHAAVFIHLLEHPESTIRTIAGELDLAERTVVGVLQDLRRDGYFQVQRVGRNNVYRVNPEGHMKRPEHSDYTVGEFLGHVQSVLAQAASALERHTSREDLE